MKRSLNLFLAFLFLAFWSCQDDDLVVDPTDPSGQEVVNLEDIPYEPEPYDLNIPDGFPPMSIPADNPMTVDGVALGRFLFYDPILSGDSTMSCATCHGIEGSFTDNLALSPGITGELGRRSSMSLLNVGFNTNGLFWDGRVQTLEEQAFLPIEDPVEMHSTWEESVKRLKRHPDYPERFRKAFGIANSGEITASLTVKAIAQFERILISSGTSRYDKRFIYLNPTVDLTEGEQNGFDMFFDEPTSDLPDAQCFHCHGGVLLTTNEYFNNGLQEAATLNDFNDPGRGAVTGNLIDNGKMRAPTLRNIMLTAPYMHDGRFATIEEVLDFYNEGVHYADNLDENLIPEMGLTEEMKADLIEFMHMFTDTAFVNNPAFKNPFEE